MLTLARYRVIFEACEPLDLPPYLGSTIRGAFGNALRAVACPAPRNMECPAPNECPYHLLFETSPPPDSDALRTHEEIPRPFVLAFTEDSPEAACASEREARRLLQPGDELAFELALVGQAQRFWPHLVVALREVNRIGRKRRAVALKRIEALTLFGEASLVYDASENLVRAGAPSVTLEDCPAMPASCQALEIRFLTQTRLKQEGFFARRPDFQLLFRRLLGRLSSLARFHCGAPLELDFRGLIERAGTVQLIEDATRWTSWRRYSSRQDRRMEWGGIVGRAVYRGEFAEFWKYLWFGQFVHVGHGATFGLGRYALGIQER